MTAEEILTKSKWLKDKDVEKIITFENYGIVFIKQDEIENDLTNLYEEIGKLVYNQAKKLA